jgi:hypothetical protein
MEIRLLTMEDINAWEKLSYEYDCYVKELVPDLTEWYEGNGTKDSLSFKFYMEDKIIKKEAFMAMDQYKNCLGIVAFSRENNRITFFGISHNADIKNIGNLLLKHALNQLDKNKDISINEIANNTDWIQKCKEIILENGFIQEEDSLENGVPVNTFKRKGNK